MKTNILLSLVLVTFLGGCAALDQYDAEQQRLSNEKMERDAKEISELLNKRCEYFGFRPGTDAFATCKVNEFDKTMAVIQRDRAAKRSYQQQESYYQKQKRLDDERESRPSVTTGCTSLGGGNFSCTSR